jgi:hypothetical protein
MNAEAEEIASRLSPHDINSKHCFFVFLSLTPTVFSNYYKQIATDEFYLSIYVEIIVKQHIVQ